VLNKYLPLLKFQPSYVTDLIELAVFVFVFMNNTLNIYTTSLNNWNDNYLSTKLQEVSEGPFVEI